MHGMQRSIANVCLHPFNTAAPLPPPPLAATAVGKYLPILAYYQQTTKEEQEDVDRASN